MEESKEEIEDPVKMEVNEESAEINENAEESEDTEGNEEKSEVEEGDAETNLAVEGPYVDVEKLLQTKIKLGNGAEVLLFSYGPPRKGGVHRQLNCHLCRRACIKSRSQRIHLRSLRHKRMFGRAKKIKPRVYNKPYYQFYDRTEEGNLVHFIINPGENIPEVTDEYKDRVTVKNATYYMTPKTDDYNVIEFEKLHDYNENMPLLGLDYIFKMRADDKVIYHCALCEIKIKGDAYNHIVGSAHQAAYIIKHFPKLYAKVKQHLKFIKNEAAAEQRIRNIFRYFYHKCEISRRRAKIHLVDFEYFQKNHDEIVKECQNRRHLNEDTINITLQEVDTIVKKTLKGEEFIKQDLKSLEKPELGPRELIPIKLANSGSKGKDDPAQKRSRQDHGKLAPENYAAYHLMLENQLNDINAKYKMYETNPTSHPEYNKEWQLFNREEAEKLKKGKNGGRNYNFKSKWIQRLHQLYAKDVASCKRELKRILNSPFDRSPSPVKQMDQQIQPERMEWQPQQQPQPPQPIFKGPNINPDRPAPIFTEETSIASSELLSVISVMRLLSALEDQLGSLGPKAVQFLSKAVLCEKDNGDADELLLDSDCYVFFATVKEKFRGQLQANLIDPSKIRAVTHCVNELSAILQIMKRAQAKERERERKDEQKLKQQQLKQQSSGNFTGVSGGGNNPQANPNSRWGQNRNGRKRKTAGNVISRGNNSTCASGSNSGRSDLEQSFSAKNFDTNDNNYGTSFSGRNDFGRNFGGGNDFGRNVSGGKVSGRNFNCGYGSGKNFSEGNNLGSSFGTGNFESRNPNGNFGIGSSFYSNFDNKNDNFNKNLGSGNDRWGNFESSLNDMGGNFSGGSNDNFRGDNEGSYGKNYSNNDIFISPPRSFGQSSNFGRTIGFNSKY